MAYDYIRRTYGKDYKAGQRVQHTVSRALGEGVVAREDVSMGNYVMVKFGGNKHAVPCHPDELEVLA